MDVNDDRFSDQSLTLFKHLLAIYAYGRKDSGAAVIPIEYLLIGHMHVMVIFTDNFFVAKKKDNNTGC